MALAPPGTQLGCGRDIDQVWDHINRAPDAHERTCPYCQAARADLAGLAQATQAMRDDDTTNPDFAPGPHVLDRILTVARAEVRRGRRLPLDQPRGDSTSPGSMSVGTAGAGTTSANTVSEQAVTAVIRRVADRTREVQIRRCSLTADPATNRPAGTMTTDGLGVATPREGFPDPGPASVEVSLRVSVASDRAIVEAGNQLRAAVIDAVMQEVGMNVVAVNITVEDLHDA